jgi:hypothetical protein
MLDISSLPFGLPALDELPVEKLQCQECHSVAPAVVFMGFRVVICPECRKVYPYHDEEE